MHAADHSAISKTHRILQAQGSVGALLSMAMRFFGLAIAFAGLGLVVFPFGGGTVAEVLTRFMVAMILGFGGAAMWQAGQPKTVPEMDIDMVKRELRILSWNARGEALRSIVPFAELGGAEMSGEDVRFYDIDGTILTELYLPDEITRNFLRSALREEGVPV